MAQAAAGRFFREDERACRDETHLVGASDDLDKSLVMLNRKTWHWTGITCDRDSRHCETVVKTLGSQQAKTVGTLAVGEADRAEHEDRGKCSWESLQASEHQMTPNTAA